MPTYLSPGVYVEEVPLTPSIAGVGTSTAAFIGIADLAAADMPADPATPPDGRYQLVAAGLPVLVTNWEQFKRQFGDINEKNEVLAQSVYGFFNNGGGRCWVARVGSRGTAGATAAKTAAATAKANADAAKTAADTASTAADTAKTGADAAKTAADDSAADPNDVPKQAAAKTAIDTAKTAADTAKTAADTAKTAADTANIGAAETAAAVAAATALAAAATTAANAAAVTPADPPGRQAAALATAGAAAPAAATAEAVADTAKRAVDEAAVDVTTADRADAADAADATAVRDVLAKMEAIDEIAIVAVPGAVDTDIRTNLKDHCENLKDRVAVLDGIRTTTITPEAIKGSVTNSDYVALYFPWIEVADPLVPGGGTTFVPPSGLMAGIYARVDGERGVHKAPANVPVRGALALEYAVSTREQDGLNPQGINAIRLLAGTIRVWGARTMGGDLNESFGGIKYISVRRLMNFLRESIDEGTQFAVFEPNSPPLWQRIIRSVEGFLTGVWRDGALFGTVPGDAFRVICDETTNPPDVRARGQVVTEIWVAPVKPAEFVIFRINQVNEIPA